MARRAKTGQDEPALRLTIVRHRSPPHKIDPMRGIGDRRRTGMAVVLFALRSSIILRPGLVTRWVAWRWSTGVPLTSLVTVQLSRLRVFGLSFSVF